MPHTQIDQKPVTQITIIEAESERQTEALRVRLGPRAKKAIRAVVISSRSSAS